MRSTIRKIIWAFLALVIVQSACNFTPTPVVQPTPTSIPTTTPKVSTPTLSPTLEGIIPGPSFTYNEISFKLPQSFSGGGYTLPISLGDVHGMAGVRLTDAQRSLLSQNGFVVAEPVPGQYREFYQVYDSLRYSNNLVFITTDSVYHIYHLIFDKMLRDLESGYFIADLRSLTGGMLAACHQQYQSLSAAGSSLAEPARRNVAYIAVAAQLLGLPDPVPAEASDLVSAELALINAAGGWSISPIWDRPDLPADLKLQEDYSQYIPRGHYTRSEDLKMYFKAMMWYGRLAFRLIDDFETQRALLLTQVMRTAVAADGTPALTKWEDIYEPTVFIVGKADDLGILEYGKLSDQVFSASSDPNKFADPALFAQFKQASESLPPPQINSMWVWIWQDQEQVTKGFRFMGQRFTLDEYVFGQVLWRKVGTLTDPRGLPKALDFLAALGSDEAYSILNDMGETHYENYDTQLTKVKSEFAALGSDSWTQNLYWNWLYSLQPLIKPKGSAYPSFMQTEAWARKDLQAALSSWTELKHDTILYTKQVMAEMGGGGGDVAPPHGYVEPNPEAYARLLALTQMTYDGLDARSLLTDTTRANLENLISQLQFLKDISEKELAGEVITDDEYWHIQYWGGILEDMTLAAADTTDIMNRDLSDQKAALVADVANGPDSNGSVVVLEEGVGQPTRIYVVLPDSPWRVAIGAVYSYYEFTVPPSGRMTDEAWQAQVEAGNNPHQPDWTQMFVSP